MKSIRSYFRIFVSIILIFVFFDVALAATWHNTFGGNQEDWGRIVNKTGDGGYIITG